MSHVGDRGNPQNVRVGPGTLYLAPLGTAEPADLDTAWNAGFVKLGYTEEGSEFVFDNTFEDVMVAEELEPVAILQTMRNISINFALAEMTAANMQRAFNGGTVTTPGGGLVTYEPPSAGQYTEAMLGWESDDHLERWIFRRVLQTGPLNIARRKAPDKAQLPMSFRAIKPTSATAFKLIHAVDYEEYA